MSSVRKTVTFTKKQDEWIKKQIRRGDYTNDSEYLRDLVRRDQYKKAEILALKAEIQKGLDSGVSTKNLSEIMKEVEEKMNADGRL